MNTGDEACYGIALFIQSELMLATMNAVLLPYNTPNRACYAASTKVLDCMSERLLVAGVSR